MLNALTYNVVVHEDEPSHNRKTVENNRSWIKLIIETVLDTKT